MGFRKAPGSEAGSSKSWSDEKGLVRGMRHARTTSQSSNYGGSLFSRALPDNLFCAGVDDSDDELESKRRSVAIDKYLESQRAERGRQLNITAIGACEQKRILWKQMRLRERPLNQEERSTLFSDVRKTVLKLAIRSLEDGLDQLEESESLNSSFDDDLILSIRESLEYVASCSKKDDTTTAELILQLAQSSDLQAQFDASKISFHTIQRKIVDAECPSFLTCTCTDDGDIFRVLNRVFSSGYEPTEHDWLHFERSRHGVFVREAHLREGDKVLNFLDVYSHAERKKWMHIFEDLAAIVFVVDPSRYTVRLEGECVPMEESVNLFDSIANASAFVNKPILLLMSNTAAFFKKLETQPLQKFFPEYNGSTDAAALEFTVQRYKNENRSGKDVCVYQSRGNGVDNQEGFLDTLTTAISNQQSVDAGKKKNRIPFISS